MLHLNNFTKKYGEKIILDHVSVNIKRGEIAMFLGSSGVGKSTLLRILNNLEQLDSGSAQLDGKDLDISKVHQTHTVGMVFQQFNLFEHLTVIENIMLPLRLSAHASPDEALKITQALLTHYDMIDKAYMYPAQLSGGQKQRVALMRTLALNPTIICLDEPTSALDPLLTSHVAQIINELARSNYIVLVASHDTLLLEKLSCTIYLMKNGRVKDPIQSDQFYKNKEAYPALASFISGNTHKDSSWIAR